MNWADLWQALYDLPLAQYVRESPSGFPWVESTHVLAVTAVAGSIAVVDLRLLGYPAHRRSAYRLINELLPITWAAFVVAVITGSMLFISNATAYVQSFPFKAKMVTIAIAGLNMAYFHLTAHRRISEWDERLPPPRSVRFAGAASLILWTIVIFFGRWIGFSAPLV